LVCALAHTHPLLHPLTPTLPCYTHTYRRFCSGITFVQAFFLLLGLFFVATPCIATFPRRKQTVTLFSVLTHAGWLWFLWWLDADGSGTFYVRFSLQVPVACNAYPTAYSMPPPFTRGLRRAVRLFCRDVVGRAAPRTAPVHPLSPISSASPLNAGLHSVCLRIHVSHCRRPFYTHAHAHALLPSLTFLCWTFVWRAVSELRGVHSPPLV